MQYVICYDITDDHRRQRLATLLQDFGRRIQESVFLADLDDQLIDALRLRISSTIEPHLDAVHIFSLCRACTTRTEALGIAYVPKDEDFYIL